MKVFILSAYPPPHDFVSNWLIAAAKEDFFGVHTRVDDPADAELIVFAEGHTAEDPYYLAVRTHPLRKRYPDRCFLYHDEDYVLPLLPGLFPALEIQDRDPTYAVGAPYIARITENPIAGPAPAAGADGILYSFVGTATTHPVRREIMKLTGDERACCEDTGGVHEWTLSPEERAAYLSRFSDVTARSKFVLCPRGHSPSTYRLYETMEAGRAPVIVSDVFTPPDGPDWATISLRVAEAETATIPELLRRHEHVAAEMGAKARVAWELWFAPSVSFHRTAEACKDMLARRAAAGAGADLTTSLPPESPGAISSQERASPGQATERPFVAEVAIPMTYSGVLMRFDNPAWQEAPLRTGLRVLTSLVRKRIGPLRTARVPYDGGRTSIHADLSTALGLILYRYGNRDADIELVKRLLSPGDVFVDGGANIGLFTLAAAAKVGATGKVIAFEPGREVRMRLTQNVALNRLVQVEVIPFALSSAPGEATFRTFDAAGAGLNHLGPSDGEAGTVEVVKLTTLDAAVGANDRRRMTVLKLDLEGAEHAALQGAAEILRDVRPHIIIEMEDSHLRRMGSSVAEVAALLEGHGYQFFQARMDGAREVSLSRLGDVRASKSGPNVFATTDPAGVQSKGLRIV